MKLKHHLVSAVPLGLAYYSLSSDLNLSLVAMGTTALIDLDHLFDYLATQKRIDSITKMLNAFKTFRIVKKNYFLLHSWEIVFLFGYSLFFFYNPFLVAIFIGYAYHVLLDQIYNTQYLGKYNLKICFYFFFYRMFLCFDVLRLRKEGESIDKNEQIYHK